MKLLAKPPKGLALPLNVFANHLAKLFKPVLFFRGGPLLGRFLIAHIISPEQNRPLQNSI